MVAKLAGSPILSIAEVAEYLDVSEMTIYRYAKAGKIPAFKVGAKWRFNRKSIDRWIEEKEKFNVSGKDRRGKSQASLFES